MNAKILVFVICVEAIMYLLLYEVIMYLLLYDLRDCTFKDVLFLKQFKYQR